MNTYSKIFLTSLLLLVACSGEGDKPDPNSGQISISIEKLTWIHRHNEGRNRLSVAIKISNPIEGSALPLMPGLFSLETQQGTGVTAMLAPEGKVSHHCPADLTLLMDAERTCTYWFDLPQNETPKRVALAPPGGETIYAGDFEACSGGGGQLCDYGRLCQAGQCVEACTRSTPQGACATDGFRCVLGKCVGVCSAQQPDGYCDQGGCYDGSCSTSQCTFTPKLAEQDCSRCIAAACAEADCLLEAVCPRECQECLFSNGDSCSCSNSDYCHPACVVDFKQFVQQDHPWLFSRCGRICELK